MDEATWLACQDPTAMLAHLHGRAGARKLRLFGLACCRRLWALLPDDRWRKLVEVGEQFADQAASRAQLNTAWWRVPTESGAPAGQYLVIVANNVGSANLTPEKLQALTYAAAQAVATAAGSIDGEQPGCPPRDAESAAQAGLVRCIFGNPFRLPALEAAWLAWNEGTVPRLAQAAYEERRLPSGLLEATRLSVLADALEDAGCAGVDLLGHLRDPRPHVRGCWPVDLLLGKS